MLRINGINEYRPLVNLSSAAFSNGKKAAPVSSHTHRKPLIIVIEIMLFILFLTSVIFPDVRSQHQTGNKIFISLLTFEAKI